LTWIEAVAFADEVAKFVAENQQELILAQSDRMEHSARPKNCSNKSMRSKAEIVKSKLFSVSLSNLRANRLIQVFIILRQPVFAFLLQE